MIELMPAAKLALYAIAAYVLIPVAIFVLFMVFVLALFGAAAIEDIWKAWRRCRERMRKGKR